MSELMEQTYTYCGQWFRHKAHDQCPGTGRCGNLHTHDSHIVTGGPMAPFWCRGNRIRLYREHHTTVDGRRLAATTWRDLPLPVMISDRIVGMITTLRKEEESGWVTGLLTLTDPDTDVSGLAAQATFTGGEVTMIDEEISLATNAKLIGIVLGENPTWEDMVFT